MTNPDLERDHLKVPKLTQGDKSSSSPLPPPGLEPTTTNGVADNVFPATSNGVEDNVIHPDHNMHSASVNGVDLDSQALSDDSYQGTTADENASVTDL